MDAIGIDNTDSGGANDVPSQTAQDEEENVPVESSIDICRVCLHGNLIMRDLFGDDEVLSLSAKVMGFTTVKMLPGDGLPTQICCDCADKLETAYEFKLQVEQADNVLHERYDNLNIKEELFFNEVEVRHEDVPGIDVEAQYEAAARTLNTETAKSIINDHLDLLEIEKLSENNRHVLDSSSIVEAAGDIIPSDSNQQNESEKQQSLSQETEYLQEAEESSQEHIMEVNSENRKPEILNGNEGIAIAEHNYMVQQNYTLTSEQEQELMEEDSEGTNSQDFPTLMLDDEEENEDETQVDGEVAVAQNDDEEISKQTENIPPQDQAMEEAQKECDPTSDEESYFENLNLSCRLKQYQDEKSDKVVFMCYLCDKQCVSKEILKEHMHSHEEVRKTLSLKKTPERNLKSSPQTPKTQPSGKKSNKCPYCGKEYLYIISFNKHIKQHEKNDDEMKGTSEAVNNSDSEDFDNTDTFEIIHEEKVEDDDNKQMEADKEIFSCTKCNGKFPTKTDLQRHMLHNHQEKSALLQCNICDETFDSVDKLKDHRSTHVIEGVISEQEFKEEFGEGSPDKSIESELKCPNCSMTFMSKKLLAKHMDSHEKTKYRCKICNQEFTKKDLLKKHAEQHAKLKSFKCTECSKVFNNELTLRNHLIATNHKTIVQGEEYDPNKRIKRVAARAAQKIIDKIKTDDRFEDSERDEDNDDFGADTHQKMGKNSEKMTKKNQKKDLECATCNKKCSSKQQLMKHMEAHAKEEKEEKAKKAEVKDFTKPFGFGDMDDNDDDDDDFESGLDWPMDIHECPTCKKRYSTKKSLLRHQLLHEEPNFECDICNVKFYRKDKLKAHYDKCSEKNPDQVRKCNICGDTFENNEILREHRGKHVDEGILTEEDLKELEPSAEDRKQGEKIARKRRTDIVGLECTECNKQYTSRKGLLRHIQVHEGKKYLCDICPKKFYRREHLKIHVAKHNMVKPYKCTRCSKRFIKEEQLTAHLTKKHERPFKKNKESDGTSSKRFLCEICSKSFTQSTTLVAHLRAHNGIKPYVCEVCARPFTTNAYLKMHMRTHTQERPYTCQYCARAFARADTLANHLTSHTGEAKYHCKYCPKNFRRLKSLKEHIFIHTGQRPYACPTCDRRFNNNGSRYAHSKRCKQNLLQNQNRQGQAQQQAQPPAQQQPAENIVLTAQIQQPQIQQPQPTQQIQQIQQIQEVQQIQQVQQVQQIQHIQVQQNPQTIRLAQAVGPTMQVVQSKNIKTITITRQPDQVGQHQIMQHQEILMPLILPLAVTLTDGDEEVILPEGTKIFTTT